MIFKKLFVSVFTTILVGTIVAFIYGYINQLKVIPAIFLTILITGLIGSLVFSSVISAEFKYTNLEISDNNLKMQVHEILTSKNYLKVQNEINLYKYKLNVFPKWIYNDIEVIINEDKNTGTYKMTLPKYLVKDLI
jgi:hypothetical protein